MYDFQWAKAYPVIAGQAAFKTKPEDFRVEEHLSFSLSGTGEHLYCNVQKKDLSTTYVADQLARWAGIKVKDVSFAGLKDRQSVSRQWFSLWLPGKSVSDQPMQLPQCQMLSMTKHDRKLRRGAIAFNRFVILLRAVTADQSAIEARLAQIAQDGVPNYFGPQRFGYQGANLTDAVALLSRRKIGRDRKSMLLSAVRSYLFNQSLDRLVRSGLWRERVVGQPLQLSGSKSWFLAEGSDEELTRIQSGDCSPTLVLYSGGLQASEVPLIGAEQASFEQYPELTTLLDDVRLEPARRATILRIKDLKYTWSGSDLQVEFSLPTGTYATSVIAELLAVNSG